MLQLMVLSALKGVGSILFEAEEVKSLFLYLLDRHSKHQNGDDSKQILSTHETQILCLLLEVNTSSCMYIHSEGLVYSSSSCLSLYFLMVCKLLFLLQVLFSVEDQTNLGFDKSEALLKALKASKILILYKFQICLLRLTFDIMQLQVDGLSPKDPVAVMPCLTALQNLQPVFFENLKTDTKVFFLYYNF